MKCLDEYIPRIIGNLEFLTPNTAKTVAYLVIITPYYIGNLATFFLISEESFENVAK